MTSSNDDNRSKAYYLQQDNFEVWSMILLSGLAKEDENYAKHLDLEQKDQDLTQLEINALSEAAQKKRRKAEAACLNSFLRSIDKDNMRKVRSVVKQGARVVLRHLGADHLRHSANRQELLKSKLRSCKFHDAKDMRQFLATRRGLYEDLLAAGSSLGESEFVLDTLTALPPIYHVFRTIIRRLPANERGIDLTFPSLETEADNIKIDTGADTGANAMSLEEEQAHSLVTTADDLRACNERIDKLVSAFDRLAKQLTKKGNDNKQTCRNFSNFGTCKYGDKCKYEHVRNAEQALTATTNQAASYSFSL